MMKLFGSILVVVSACGGGGGGGDACDQAVSHMVDVATNDGSERRNPPPKEYMDKVTAAVKTAVADTCRQDKWADQLITCFKTAVDYKAAHACEDQFTGDQQKHVEAAIDKAQSSIPRPPKK